MKETKFIRLIFLGDTHGFVNDFEKQRELIEKYDIKIVLYEQLQNISLKSSEEFEKFILNKKFSEMTSFSEVEDIVLLCKEKNIDLIGIDIHNFGLNEELQRVVNGKKEPSEKDIVKLDSMQIEREKIQVEKIKKALLENDENILVITGAWHLRENGLIRNSFEKYLMIIPTNKDGDMLLAPPGDDFVKFEEILKCPKK